MSSCTQLEAAEQTFLHLCICLLRGSSCGGLCVFILWDRHADTSDCQQILALCDSVLHQFPLCGLEIVSLCPHLLGFVAHTFGPACKVVCMHTHTLPCTQVCGSALPTYTLLLSRSLSLPPLIKPGITGGSHAFPPPNACCCPSPPPPRQRVLWGCRVPVRLSCRRSWQAHGKEKRLHLFFRECCSRFPRGVRREWVGTGTHTLCPWLTASLYPGGEDGSGKVPSTFPASLT